MRTHAAVPTAPATTRALLLAAALFGAWIAIVTLEGRTDKPAPMAAHAARASACLRTTGAQTPAVLLPLAAPLMPRAAARWT